MIRRALEAPARAAAWYADRIVLPYRFNVLIYTLGGYLVGMYGLMWFWMTTPLEHPLWRGLVLASGLLTWLVYTGWAAQGVVAAREALRGPE